ncbi:hypothetical protein ASD04_11325 [Devosia sp. Root436]|uniref:phosphoribosyltransferase-like protein n=1 Tax=Devosia sp. Root436 TaxID=1736537 RepID=UPI0006FD3B0A|nr:hypothetical protein [Devosia sp. Root436]KQX38203.1 hypothetical protein ASD04_11325 [Devosia sp. Root436]
MNRTVALRLLGEIMNWDDLTAGEEYQWLGFMAKLKYDGYRDFVAGARFLESLAGWLRQFAPEDRSAAYALMKDTLVYFGPIEIRRLVESFYPDIVFPWAVSEVARRKGIPDWLVSTQQPDELKKFLRQTLFVALSEGAHTDAMRHATPSLSNEQIIVSHQVDDEKWAGLVKDLREDTKDPNALFARAYLVDDFTASGTTLIRREANGDWKGKIPKFLERVAMAESRSSIFEEGWTLGVHHYISTAQADAASNRLVADCRDAGKIQMPDVLDMSYGYLLPSTTKHDVEAEPLKTLIYKYYDKAIETRHNTAGGGSTAINAGYKDCALTVVLDHNTPNNSLPILWAESEGTLGHAMRPLFRRRQRHT